MEIRIDTRTSQPRPPGHVETDRATMNLMYYRMVNGYGYYPSLPAAPSGGPSPGAGLLGSGATAAASGTLPIGGATPAAAASSLVPKWVMPNFSATQIQYMFRNRMDKGLKVNKAVKCELCSITLNSEQQAQQHYSGKSHLKKLRQGKKKDGESDKDSDRRRSKDRGKSRDKNLSKDKEGGEDEDEESKDEDESSRKAESDSKSEKDEAELEDDQNDEDDTSSSKDNDLCSDDVIEDKLDNDHSQEMSPKESDFKDMSCDDLERSETCVSSSDLERSKVICQNIDKSQNETQDGDWLSTTDSLTENVLENDEINCERISDSIKTSQDPQPGTVVSTEDMNELFAVKDDSLEATDLSEDRPPSHLSDSSSSLSSSRTSSLDTSVAVVTSSQVLCSSEVPLTSDGAKQSECPSSCDSAKQTHPCGSLPTSGLGTIQACRTGSLSVTLPTPSSTTSSIRSSRSSSSFSSMSFSGTSSSDSLRNSRPLKRPYESLSRTTYQSSSLSSGLHSTSTTIASTLIPRKKPHTSYLNSGALDLRSQALLASPHLALTPNSIPAYNSLRAASSRHISDPTVQSPGLMRPLGSTLASPLTTYSTPQYGSPLQGSLTPSAYPLSYQPELGSTAVPRGLLNQYFPQSTPTATPQTPAMLQTPEALSLDQNLLNTELMSSPVVGQQVTLKYASAVPTTTSMPYQYGTSFQAISIQALGNDPGSSAMFPSGFSSNTSPQYLSFSDLPGGGSTSAITSGATTQQVQTPVPGWAPANPARVPATLTQQQGQGQGHSHGQSYQNVVKPQAGTAQKTPGKLDPVSQAVYDNVLGNLPTKRKREIPCQVCDLVFNSEGQANAHFAGTKHIKKQKVQDISTEELGKGVSRRPTGVPFYCQICRVSLNSQQQLDQHKAGQQHRNKEGSEVTKYSSAWNEVQGNRPGWFYCATCDISVPTAMTLQQHTKGKLHKETAGSDAE